MNERQITGWLPKDERKLLVYYFTKLKRPKDSEVFRNPVELMEVIGYRQGSETKPEDAPELFRVEDANESLMERGLAVFPNPQNLMCMDTTVSLTLKGWDLGRKYACRLTRSGLWFEEYRNHWIWLIVAFLGGIVGALIVEWLR
jgi:hypothetical protein